MSIGRLSHRHNLLRTKNLLAPSVGQLWVKSSHPQAFTCPQESPATKSPTSGLHPRSTHILGALRLRPALHLRTTSMFPSPGGQAVTARADPCTAFLWRVSRAPMDELMPRNPSSSFPCTCWAAQMNRELALLIVLSPRVEVCNRSYPSNSPVVPGALPRLKEAEPVLRPHLPKAHPISAFPPIFPSQVPKSAALLRPVPTWVK